MQRHGYHFFFIFVAAGLDSFAGAQEATRRTMPELKASRYMELLDQGFQFERAQRELSLSRLHGWRECKQVSFERDSWDESSQAWSEWWADVRRILVDVGVSDEQIRRRGSSVIENSIESSIVDYEFRHPAERERVEGPLISAQWGFMVPRLGACDP